MIANPVLRKELLMRMRFGRQPTAQRVGVCLAILLLLGFIYFKAYEQLSRFPSANDGHSLWFSVVLLQFIFICMIAPIVAANAITQEREQMTWEMLIFTRLTASEIIVGKLIARFVTVVLIILLGLPMALVAAHYANKGGVGSSDYVSPLQFCGVYLMMLIVGLFFATFGLFMSWLVKRTLYAVMAAYTFVVAGLLLGTVLVAFILSSLIGDFNFLYKCPLMWFNPGQIFKEAASPDSRLDSVFLVYGLVGYVLLTVLMLWRMIAGFRRFGYEG
jgi:ABC-type transport system involved in multi-copper enzyme maturation permease subunit